jgi:metal-dependent amidase/aminoacylase/carboxypeptidase family protein
MEAVFGAHTGGHEGRQLRVTPGAMMCASSKRVPHITIRGKAARRTAALGIDPVPVAAQMVMAFRPHHAQPQPIDPA